MSILSENVIPGNHGKVFATNTKNSKDLERIKEAVLTLKGIEKVTLNSEVFPHEFTVFTNALIQVKDIENKVNLLGFNAIPKEIFEI